MQKPKPIKGRYTASNAASRFVEFTREAIDDGWEISDKLDCTLFKLPVKAGDQPGLF